MCHGDIAIRKKARIATRQLNKALKGKYKIGIEMIPIRQGINLREKALTPNESKDRFVKIQNGWLKNPDSG
jgi:hypothetical protein